MAAINSMAGGRRASAQTLEARGTKDKTTRKAQGFDAPKAIPGRPKTPFWLTDDEKTVWGELCDTLESRGQLCADDYWALYGLVTSFCQLREMHKVIRENGYTQDVRTYRRGRSDLDEDDPEGVMTRARPEFKLMMELDTKVRYWLQEFGLTPVTRVRAPVVPKDNYDPKDPLKEFGLQ